MAERVLAHLALALRSYQVLERTFSKLILPSLAEYSLCAGFQGRCDLHEPRAVLAKVRTIVMPMESSQSDEVRRQPWSRLNTGSAQTDVVTAATAVQ
ncbi:hypothetical protein C1J03_12040 [Sulfitobacter sp. SK012]|nr:hypothetical protein C1J03_12040 [Sulfitobacter sp. SK012]